MISYTGYDPLQKLVRQLDAAEAEIRRMETVKVTLSEERERLVASGKFEDERSVIAASTLGTKLAMIPFKVQQLKDLRQSVCDDLGRPIQTLRNGLSDERNWLMRTAHDGLVPAIALALQPFFAHTPDSIEAFAERIAGASLVMECLAGIDPVEGQDRAPIEQARNLLSIAVAFERIRAAFFTGDKLNLDAVAKRKSFSLTG